MMNVGENRVRNGVTDCPESRNEEIFQNIELLDSSRYATDLKYLKSSGFLRGNVFTSPDRCFSHRTPSD
ncbi:hypothetical protein E3N88_22530 [Mikania micrantha]|uniref:Uncharacterized protein n=1 Tax=Mikania micrantha TaxID=192012 RepID=A0A5N6NBT0_9ASTR|nr:hypothetical protein E3N88_22530 [Mikania micrantha]